MSCCVFLLAHTYILIIIIYTKLSYLHSSFFIVCVCYFSAILCLCAFMRCIGGFAFFVVFFGRTFYNDSFLPHAELLLSHYKKQTKTTIAPLKRNYLVSLCCFVLCVSALAKLSMPLSRREAFFNSAYISLLCLVHFSYAISRNVPFMIQRDVFVIKQFNKVFVTKFRA